MNSDQIKIRDYRPYKKLSLAQRIQVVKAYKYLQNYQKLARLFNCSAMQIKCIIACQDELLERYESFRVQNINNCAEPDSHEEKMDLLGKVVFEYLLRAMNSRMPTDTAVIRQKALEVKKALGIEDFTPDEQWLHAFKVNSNRLDLMDLMEKLENNIENRRSLDCNDIIEYIREQDREERRKLIVEAERIARLSPTFEKLSQDRVQAKKQESFRKENRYNEGSTPASVPKRKKVVEEKDIRRTRVKLKTAARRCVQEHTEVNIKSETEDDLEVKQEKGSSDDNQEITSGDCKIFKIIKVESINTTANNSTSPEIPTTISASRGGLSSYAEALRYLRKLENFVMNQEDYEALSVITHLEYIFRNSK
uniref:HTH CENPB-type domain-containing protein n=1 Tax=Ceratitis capitata TaxID=7213 RepID=W8ASL4_CERCA